MSWLSSSTRRQVCAQEAPRLVKALLRRGLTVAGMRAHGKAMGVALVEHELADLPQFAHPGFQLTHARDRRLFVLRAVQDQHGDVDPLGEVVGLRTGVGPGRTKGEAVKDHDGANLLVGSGRHERVYAAAAEAE